MNPYFAFSDESGNYAQVRGDQFLCAHPFYVRSTIMISMNDYITMQEKMALIKSEFELTPQVEVKWSHYGGAIKNNYRKIQHRLTAQQLKEYYVKCLSLLSSLSSVVIYYTFTENKSVGKIDEIALLKMHLQNAYQRVQQDMTDKDGYAIFIIDDLDSKSNDLKKAAYKMTLAGDYVQYTNIKKGLYVDFSDQCPGLQMADICAGIFTASLKYMLAQGNERYKFQLGYELFFEYAYKKTRHMIRTFPYSQAYRYGIKEVPVGTGEGLAKDISSQVEHFLDRDFLQEIMEMD